MTWRAVPNTVVEFSDSSEAEPDDVDRRPEQLEELAVLGLRPG